LISIAILFLIALISSIAQKFTDYYSNFPKSTFSKNFSYEITTESSDNAVRKTIENFDNKDDYKVSMKNENEEKIEESIPKVQESEKSKFYYFDELSSVRVVRKIDTLENINEKDQIMEDTPTNLENDYLFTDIKVENTSQPISSSEIQNDDNANYQGKSDDNQSPLKSPTIKLNFEKVAVDFPINTFFENNPIF
jgi:hypothetical protein